jgi:hypothetical protein
MTALKVRGQLTVKGVWGGEMMWFDHLLWMCLHYILSMLPCE